VGEEFGRVATSFRRFTDVEQVKEAIVRERPSQRYILIKGSNSVRLYQLPELL